MGERVVAVKGEAPALDIRLESGESLAAAAVVNAAGPASQQVNAMLGVGKDFTVGQRLIRHELHHVELPAMQGPTAHIVDGDLGINFRPEGTGGFLVGSSGAPSTVKKHWFPRYLYRASHTRDLVPPCEPRQLPDPRAAHPCEATGVAGVYDVTDDWLPIYDRTDRPGIFVAVGTSGNQFKTAPMVGELMADLITAAFEGRDTDEDRFVTRLPYSGRQIDTSVFSRRRTPKAGGSRG